MSQSRIISFFIATFVLCLPLSSAAWLQVADVWNAPAFSVEPAALLAAANAVPPVKDSPATMLLDEIRFSYDAQGRAVKTIHRIFRIDTPQGVEDWSEVRASWLAWYQDTPEIRARVITSDGVAHKLDAKTLNDVSRDDEDSADTSGDARAYGGPLPAVAAGAVVEEEIVRRDHSSFFAAGDNERILLAWTVPLVRSRIIIQHPETFSIRYELRLMPEAKVAKSVSDGVETITIENGSLEAAPDDPEDIPSDMDLHPEVEIATGHSWQEVAAEYSRQIESKLRVADVQPVLARLGIRAGSNLDNVRAIVGYLHDTVRYTGVEFGAAALVPQFPAETLRRKYGDCKDKAALLITMLRAAGIPAKMALLSSGPGKDVNPQMPGLGMFDHAIVYALATGSSPELWIDATARYVRVGSLPLGDYGRWALIVDSGTRALQKTPELTAAQNFHREFREVTLAEFGPAAFVERNEQTGVRELSYREFYAGDRKKLRENVENYFKDAYLSNDPPAVENNDPADLRKPFVVTFTGKGRRGFTNLNEAVVYLGYGSIFDTLPAYFTTDEKAAKDPESAKKAQRTEDWAIEPFFNEWHYKIRAPLGFKVRALPSALDVMMGPARLTGKFTASADGSVVEAELRFDAGKALFTADDGRKMRDAVLKQMAGEAIAISFEHTGHALLGEGRTREALDVYRGLIAQHPKEALHRVQMAGALLNAGLAERARVVAREATVLDPQSALAFNMLGAVLQHDLIGRNLAAGFDYDGAVAAYRRAKQLDPKDQEVRTNLATLLEYDAEGIRYGHKAHLKEALAEFKEFRALDEDLAQKYDDFTLFDLFYAGEYKELRETAAALPGSELRKGLLLAALTLTDGVAAATKKSTEITSGDAERSKALINAGFLLLRIQHYPEAARLLEAGAAGQSSESAISPTVAILKKLGRHEDLRIDDSLPSSALQKLFAFFFEGSTDENTFVKLFSKVVLTHESEPFNAAEMLKGRTALRAAADAASLPLDVLNDVTVFTAHFTTEGDDRLGYKVGMETLGSPVRHGYIVREDNRYTVASYLGTDAEIPETIGWVVATRLEAHDLEGARHWLDWAREEIHNKADDDPLSGQPFPVFWSRGQQGDEAAARRAALVLVPSKELIGPHLAALIAFRDETKSQPERNSLNVVLASAYSAQKRWKELLPVAEELMKAAPDSLLAFHFAGSALAGIKDFASWDKLVQARLEKHPNDPDYIRSAAELARYRGEIVKERELLKGLMDRGRATFTDLNWYSWEALFVARGVDQESIDAAQRAVELTKRNNFGVLHTLACLYAQQGKTAKARELLLQAMVVGKMGEPGPEIWLGFGMIAEQYGEIDAAKTMYGRVEKPKDDLPGTSYSVAQAHLERLNQNAGKSGN